MKTIVTALVALSVLAGVAAPASAHTPKESVGINNDVNLP